MSKKEFQKAVYRHEYRLIFENIVHRKVKTTSIIKDNNEKERIRNIINELSKYDETERLVIYREYLKLFSSPYQDNLYYIIPQNLSEIQFQQAVSAYNSNKNPKKNFEVLLNSQNIEERGNVREVKTTFEQKSIYQNDLTYQSAKELLRPRIDMPSEKNLSEDKLLELPSLDRPGLISKKIKSVVSLKGNLNPERKVVKVTLRERNRQIVNNLKELYDNKCQVCNENLEVGHQEFYSEVHHIQPLGKHSGPDTSDNMIVVCPNHHTLFDKGAISIDIIEKKIIHFLTDNELNGKPLLLKHHINEEYVDYHEEHIFLKKKESLNCSRKVDYGDTVIFFDGENTEEVTLESAVNRGLMNNMQRMLLNKFEGETFTFNSFKYNVLKIMK